MSGYHYQISEASRLLDVETHVLRYWEEELQMVIPRNEMGHRYYTEEHIRIFSMVKDMKERGYQLRAIRNILARENKDDKSSVIMEVPFRKEENESAYEKKAASKPLSLDAEPDKKIVKSVPDIKPIDPIPEKKPLSPDINPVKTVPDKEPDVKPIPDITPVAPVPEILPDHTKKQNTEVIEAKNIADENKKTLEEAEKKKRFEEFQFVVTHIVAQAISKSSESLARNISKTIKEDIIYEMDRGFDKMERYEEGHFRRLDEALRTIRQNKQAQLEVAATKSPGLFHRKKKYKKRRR